VGTEFNVPILDVVRLLGLPEPYGRIAYDIQCPDCDYGTKKKHLNINTRKNVFCCPKCGMGGGVLDFYSLFSGVDRAAAYDDLKSRLGVDSVPQEKKRMTAEPKTVIEYPVLNIEVRDRTYRALLDKLSLSNDHRDNLMSRGLDERAIAKGLYKTTPVAGLPEYATRLMMDGHQLLGVPGFYKDEDTKVWTLAFFSRGIIVPVLDVNRKVQGLQIRKDNAEKRKFRWFSSADMECGARACGFIHIAGSVQRQVLLTEGPMKANIIHHLTGQTVIAVPGVNSLKELFPVLVLLRRMGVRKIMTCFDMDMVTNYHVKNGYHKLTSLLSTAGLDYGSYFWNPFYKGLDDYVWALHKQTQ